MNEWKLIESIGRVIPRKLQGEYGIGDDADLLHLQSRQLVCAADAVVENVDFILRSARPEQIGHKVLAINLSDLAAMGAKPLGYLVTLGLSKKINSAWVAGFYKGLLRLATQYKLKCLGGDLSRASEVFASVTIFGEPAAEKIILRSGARAGDLIAVTGSLGGSIEGHHLKFAPRVQEGVFLAKRRFPTAMIDVSDGLAQDLEHMLKSSCCGAEIDLSAVPISLAAMHLAKGSSQSPLSRALSDGEDFELLFTVPARLKSRLQGLWKKTFPNVQLSWIGRVLPGNPRICWMRGSARASDFCLKKKGFTHFV